MSSKLESARNWVESQPRRKGKTSYIKFLRKQKISLRQAIEAACFRCTDFSGCRAYDCPLILFSPYAVNNSHQSEPDSL